MLYFLQNASSFFAEKSESVRNDEVLLVNGAAIDLKGERGRQIKESLLRGTIPSQVTEGFMVLAKAVEKSYVFKYSNTVHLFVNGRST